MVAVSRIYKHWAGAEPSIQWAGWIVENYPTLAALGWGTRHSTGSWSSQMVQTIASILKKKASAIHSVSPDATVYDALAMMAANGIAAVLVMEQKDLLGIVSAKDFGTKVVLQGKNGKEVLAREVMTSPVATVGPDVKITEGMQIMTTKKIRHLPVL